MSITRWPCEENARIDVKYWFGILTARMAALVRGVRTLAASARACSAAFISVL